jgi:hypothetical protein
MSPAGSGRLDFRSPASAYASFSARLTTRVRGRLIRAKWLRLALAYLFGLGLVMVSGVPRATVGYVVIISACVFLGWTLGAAIPDNPGGLGERRQ